MGYGMHDYLAEKAVQRQYMRKYAMSFDEAERYKAERAGSGFHSPRNPIVTGGNRPTWAPSRRSAIFIRNYEDAVRSAEQEKAKEGSPELNASDVAPAPSLKDRIIQQVLANKYAIGGTLGAGGAGATIGALSSNKNRLRNALLGGGIGAILGGVSGHIADRFIS